MSIYDKLANKYNPMLSQLDNNGVVKNPAYNPKKKQSKKNPVSPTLMDTAPKPITGGPWDDIADSTQRIHYDTNSLGMTPEEFSGYSDAGATPGPYKTREELNVQRANNQSALAQVGNALGQAVGNEIILGTVLGLSNLVDAAVNLTADEGQNDYTNPLSTAISDMQDSVRERLAIYQKDPEATWAIDDFGWWASNSVSIASTLSMLIPSTAVMKGVSVLGKLAGASRITSGLAKAAKATGITKNATNLAKSLNTGAEIAGSAFLSRTMEGYMEARGVYEETYDKTLEKIKAMKPEEKVKLVENNPELNNLSDEDAARFISSKSADETFKNDYAMMLFDMAQFKAIGSLWKGAPNRAVSNSARRMNQRAIAKLEDETIDITKDLGFVGRLKDNALHAINNPLKSLAVIELSEGLEEGYQAVQTEKGKEIAEVMLDPNFTPRNLESYLTDGAVWEQAFWGVLGGVGFQAAGNVLGNVSKKLKDKPRDQMTEQEYALSQKSDENIRKSEIMERQQMIDSYTESMRQVDQGLNPYEYELDPITKEPMFTDGKVRNAPIASDSTDDYKMRLTNDLVTEMSIRATEQGNYDLFREFVTSNEFDKYMKDAGVQTDIVDESLSATLIRKMDDVNDVYGKALYDILHSIDTPNGDVAKLVARRIARDKLTVQDLSVAVNNLENAMDEDGRTDADNDYIREQYSDYVKVKLDELSVAKQGIQELKDQNKITNEALKQYNREFAKRESALLSLANEHAPFSERLKNMMRNENTASKAEADEFIKEFESFYSALKSNEPVGTPKRSLQALIQKSIEANDNLRHSEYMIPYYQSDYTNAYNSTAMQVDAMTIKKYNDAVDAVGEFIEDGGMSTADAIDAIMSGNVPDYLREKVDILKIGHGSTRRFWEQLGNIENEIEKKRRKQEADARIVQENNRKLAEKEAAKQKQLLDEAEAQAQAKLDEEAQQTTPSSTGEPQASEPVVADETVEDVVEESEPIPVEPQQATRLVRAIDDETRAVEGVQTSMGMDERASGIATTKTFDLFRTSRSLFDNLEGKDINSTEFQRIVDIIAEQLIDEGVSRGFAKPSAIEGMKLAMGVFYSKLNQRNPGSGDTFKRLADEIATRNRVEMVESDNDDNTGVMNAVTKLIPDGEFSKVIEDFINSYVSHRGVFTTKGNKTIINIEDLFTEIIDNNDISFEQAKHIFYNLHSYINNNDNKSFVFTNRTELNRNIKSPSTFFANLVNRKSVREEINGYMHVPTPTKKDASYEEAVRNIGLSGKVDIGYLVGDKYGVTIKTSISIKRDGVEVGYLASVKPNATNTGYKTLAQSRGFVYDVSVNNGQYTSNMDELFEPMIMNSTPEGTRLMELATKHYIANEVRYNKGIVDDLTDSEIKEILANPTISKMLMNGSILVPKYMSTLREQAQYIINTANNVLFFDPMAVTSELMLDSYSYWKSSTFKNYRDTYTIQQRLDSNEGRVVGDVIGENNNKLIVNDSSSDINLMGFDHKVNPIMIVDAGGNVSSESTNNTYSNVAGFKPGTMGMLIQDNPNAPIMALFTDSNTVASSAEIANGVRNELTNIFNSFQIKDMSFDEVYTRLANMFSGPGIESNNLFTGYNVLKSDNRIALNIDGAKGKYNLIIHKFNKGTADESTALTYIPNGNVDQTALTTKPNTRFTKAIVEEIVNTLKFNKTFYAVNNKNVEFDNSNRYITKQDGKLNVNIGDYNKTFDNFAQYVLETNAFKTNQGRNSIGGYFDNSDSTSALYIKMDSIISPVEEQTASTYLESGSMTDGVSVNEAIRLSGYNETVAKVITGDNVYGINLLPEQVYYDNKTTVALAYYNKGKTFMTRNGVRAVANDSKNLVRLLMHEHLHSRISDNSLFNESGRENLVNDLMDTYNSMILSVNNTLATVDKSEQNYKDANNIKKWIDFNKFTPDGYFSKLSKAEQTKWNNATEGERARQFAEEWLVESLTQSTIVRYLNNAESMNVTSDVENIDIANKTIWQRIIDIVLQLFNKGNTTIKNNTILAEQYAILGSIESVTSSNDVAQQVDEQLGEQHDNKMDSPLSDSPKDDTSIEQGDDTVEDSIAPTNDVTDYQTSENEIELNDDDEFDFAVTTNIQDTIEDSNISLQGSTVVPNMDNYIQSFALADRPLIAKMVSENAIKFACR